MVDLNTEEKNASESSLDQAVQDQLDIVEKGLRDVLSQVDDIPQPFEFEIYDFNTESERYEGVLNVPNDRQFLFEYDPESEKVSYAELKEKVSLAEYIANNS